MGCRKDDKDARGIAEAAQKVLDRSGFHKEAFEQIASIDLKKEEKGILSLSQDWQIPFVTYTEEELKQVPGEFTPHLCKRSQVWTMSVREVQSLPVEMAGCCREKQEKMV